MSSIIVDFAFEIGDIVWHKAAIAQQQSRPTGLLVIERHAVECHGGMQTFYKMNDAAGPMVPELALTAKKPPAFVHESMLWRQSLDDTDKGD